MANTAQARKRARQSVARNMHNSSLRSMLRTSIKRVRAAIATGDKAAATEAFQKSMSVIDSVADKKIITHYVGNHEVAMGRPHGNSTRSTHDFIPSSSDVLTGLASESRRRTPRDIYYSKGDVTEGGILSLIHNPRNLKQVHNVRNTATQKLCKDLYTNAQIVD